jgi:hypothetical protein
MFMKNFKLIQKPVQARRTFRAKNTKNSMKTAEMHDWILIVDTENIYTFP